MAILSDTIIAVIIVVVILVVAAIVIPIAIIFSATSRRITHSFIDYSTIEVSGLEGEYIPYYYGTLGIVDLWNQGYRGENIKILIIDTGINISHPDMIEVIPVNTNVVEDLHATHVGGIVGGEINHVGMVGLVPNAILYSWDYGDGSVSSIISAISWAITNGVDCLNCSFGTTSNVPALQSIIQTARTAGIYIIASAGNSSSTTLDYPANYSTVIPAASVSPDGSLSYFSSYDASHPNIVVAYGQDIQSDNAAFVQTGELIIPLSGTSMSAPFVCGVVALMLQKTLDEGGPRPTLSQMVTLIKQHLPPNPV